jgi:2-succinyl-5-enolpyruvyl-6-hydroxy-3-cyclohexene-1-carboxylate synthase
MSSRAAERAVDAFLAQLSAGGVEHVVIAPGSRNTPLTLGVLRYPDRLRPWLHVDERSAGYFALGMARESGRPVAVMCTSGTAAANLLPAIVEAGLSRVPLVVVTADRPPELRDVGASQTIDQVRMFGANVRWSTDLAVADGSIELERMAQSAAARAVDRALSAPAGPVHVNMPFHEPLVDAETTGPPVPPISLHAPRVRTRQVPDHSSIRELSYELATEQGVIVCGPDSAGLPFEAISRLAATLRWPILADPLSGLRARRRGASPIVANYDTLLRDEHAARDMRPSAAIRFGAVPTSKALNQWLASCDLSPYVVVDAGGGWRDPDGHPGAMVEADDEAFADALADSLPASGDGESGWLEAWLSADRFVGAAVRDAVDLMQEAFEGTPVMALARQLPSDSTLVVGNSMPVRDVDSFFDVADRDIRLVGTRGAAGIDGVVSTAAGASAVAGRPVTLVIGDLSFLHDQNGLWPVYRYALDLTIVLINNDGGGIFHFLPQREHASAAFEDWFGTPHGLNLRAIVEMFGGRFFAPDTGDWEEAIRAANARPGLDVLELSSDRERNVELHRMVWDHASAALRRESDARTPLA